MADMNEDKYDDTQYLISIPGMKEKIAEGLNTTLTECIPEEEVT